MYLAGPISGCTFGGCTSWREYVSNELGEEAILCASPLRNKEFLKQKGELMGSYEESPLSTARGIFTRDRFDVSRCDLLFVNFLGTTRVSIGTVMEITWANAWGKPIVLVMEKTGNVHAHPMLDETIGYHVEDLDTGIAVAKSVLAPR